MIVAEAGHVSQDLQGFVDMHLEDITTRVCAREQLGGCTERKPSGAAVCVGVRGMVVMNVTGRLWSSTARVHDFSGAVELTRCGTEGVTYSGTTV